MVSNPDNFAVRWFTMNDFSDFWDRSGHLRYRYSVYPES
jgi:hypothetical protein